MLGICTQQDYAIKAEVDLELLSISSEDQNEKERLTRLASDQQRRYRSRLVNLGDQVERSVHRFRRLPQEQSGNAVAGHVTGKVPDISFFIDRSSLLEPYF